LAPEEACVSNEVDALGRAKTDLHVQSPSAVSQVLGHEHGALLTNQEGGGVCFVSHQHVESRTMSGRELTSVAANIVRTDGKISDLEILDAVDVKALIEDTMLNDAVALLGSHGASLSTSVSIVIVKFPQKPNQGVTHAQTMPSSLDMSLNPLLNVLNILIRILQIFIHRLLIAV
jgi:hypothetical protein